MDWESHRILTRTGKFRALVFSLTRSFVVKEPLGLYAARVTTVYSMTELETWVRKRGWRLEKVSHFS
jgi:hypothetical protein